MAGGKKGNNSAAQQQLAEAQAQLAQTQAEIERMRNPAPGTTVSQEMQQQQQQAAQAQQTVERNRRGRRANILTGGQGLADAGTGAAPMLKNVLG